MLWKQLRQRIKLDDPTPPERFLGCYTRRFECAVETLQPLLQNKPELLTRKVPEARKPSGSKKSKQKQARKTPRKQSADVCGSESSTTEADVAGSGSSTTKATDVHHEYRFRDAKATARGYMYDMTQYCKDNVEHI